MKLKIVKTVFFYYCTDRPFKANKRQNTAEIATNNQNRNPLRAVNK